jgi:hypothetical protein
MNKKRKMKKKRFLLREIYSLCSYRASQILEHFQCTRGFVLSITLGKQVCEEKENKSVKLGSEKNCFML